MWPCRGLALRWRWRCWAVCCSARIGSHVELFFEPGDMALEAAKWEKIGTWPATNSTWSAKIGTQPRKNGTSPTQLGAQSATWDLHQQRKCQKRRLEYQQNTISMCNHTIVNPDKTDEWFVNAWYCFQQFLSFLWNMYSNRTKLEEDWLAAAAWAYQPVV